MIGRILLTGGIVHVIMAIFHIYLGYDIYRDGSVSRFSMGLIQALNFALTCVFFFFGYISIFHRKELVSTQIGKITMLLISVIYITRALEEFILFEFSLFVFLLCFIVGLLNLVPFVFRKFAIEEM